MNLTLASAIGLRPRLWSLCLLGAILCLCLFACPDAAYAQSSNIPDNICTDDSVFDPPPGSNKIVSVVADNLKTILLSMAQTMYNGIISQATFVEVVAGLITLYVVIYGLLFALGLVEITIYDFLGRMIKVAIVGYLVSPGSWAFFMFYLNGIVVEGGNQLIGIMAGSGLGGVTGLSGSSPFTAIDDVVGNVTSARMSISMGGMLFSGPYGPAFFGLIYLSVGLFVKALLQAMWVYIMSMVMLTFLFGTAPVFIACLLFSRTKYLFDGWMNQLVNAVLQPTLLFTFFAFFSALVNYTVEKIMSVQWCWIVVNRIDGSGAVERMWRAKHNNTLYKGEWDWQGSDAPTMNVVFPIDIIDIITFVILAQLCGSMGQIVLNIAKNIAGASTDLNMSGVGEKVAQAFRPGSGGGGNEGGGKSSGATGNRANPGDKEASKK